MEDETSRPGEDLSLSKRDEEEEEKGEDLMAERFVDSSEEEEENEPDNYEMDGFVVADNQVEEDEEQEEEENKDDGEDENEGKKKRKRKVNLELDDEDLMVISENKGESGKKAGGFKRLRKNDRGAGAADDDLASVLGFEPQEVPLGGGDDDSDIDDFIVDNVDEAGEPVRRKRDKKAPGRATRITETQLEEATSIFGDMGDFLAESRGSYDDEYRDGSDMEEQDMDIEKGDKVKTEEALKQQFEPSLLAEKFITPEDDRIRASDIPERLQLRVSQGDALSKGIEGALTKEAEWIFARVFAPLDDFRNRDNVVIPQIVATLEFLRKENFEIPFIANFRKEYITEFHKDIKYLWMIYDWDEKFVHLLNKKTSLRQMYSQVPDLDPEYIALLEQSQTETEVKDLYDHFQLHYYDAVETQLSTKYKRPVKRNFYSVCKKAGITDFGNKYFGLTAKQFGDNLVADYLANEPEGLDDEPETAAQDYIDSNLQPSFSTVNDVLKAARFVLAQEIAFDPHVRQSLRSTYHERAVISTKPTAKGTKEITMEHMYRSIKRLDKKPAVEFRDTQFLSILKAEKEGFITVTIEIPRGDHENDFVAEMEPLYLSDGTSLTTQKWNDERKTILRDALTQHLYPLFQNEVRQKLKEEAEERVLDGATRKIYNLLMRRPFTRKRADFRSSSPQRKGEDDSIFTRKVKKESVRVLAFSWAPGTTQTMGALLDPEGEMIVQFKLPFINCRSDEFAPSIDRERKAHDINELKDALREYRPHVIVVGASPGETESRRFFDEIRAVAHDEDDRIHVTWADSQVPRIYKNSARSTREFPDHPLLLRQAISLGRMMQDPLSEYASLFENEEILCLHLHPLQEMIGSDVLLERFKRVFVEVVNKVGVDINRMILHKHAASTLQFVTGLGPRKALALLQALTRRGGMVTSREEIEAILQPPMDSVESSVVYTNAIASIRVRRKWFMTEEGLDPLDDTRVHPDDYGFARKMVADALESHDDEDHWQFLVLDLMEDAKKEKKLSEIDLDTFAEEWERSGKGKKLKTLYDIKRELVHPYKDPRDKYKDPSREELFNMLTGETDSSLVVGQLVTATVVRVLQKLVICRLENGVKGVLEETNVSDHHVPLADLKLADGQSLNCRVMRIDKQMFEVNLSSRGSDLADDSLYRQSLREQGLLEDEKWLADDDIAASLPQLVDSKPAVKKRPSTGKGDPCKQRKVDHPLFHTVSFKEAEMMLVDKEVGEDAVVIRPSSKGWDHLTITWKFTPDIYIHTDVVEKGKKNATSLGKQFMVGDKQFEDLDEILYRYIRPIIDYALEMQRSRYYLALTDKPQIDKKLHQEKGSNPSRIPYYISPARDYPGKFMISYMPGTRAKHEFISVTGEGYRFRGQYLRGVEKLITWFKTHYREPAPVMSSSSSRYRASGRQSYGDHGEYDSNYDNGNPNDQWD